MHIATKTLEAINACLIADQGAKYRGLLGKAMPLSKDAYATDESPFRAHLGASIIGRECAREVWYSFHWATERKFDGRMLRLFNRGHLEEPRFVALLQAIGCTVYQFDAEGKQFKIKGHKGHYGGSLDAVVVGCPDVPDEPVLAEFKTHGDKSFQKLKTDGVMSSKWEHFVQMQQYMGKQGLKFSLYMATNKNDDEIHAEIIQFDPGQYQRYEQRSIQIIEAREPPPKISETPGFWKCKFCDHAGVCHLKTLPVKSCRSCINSTPIDGGWWSCNLKKTLLDNADQLAACDNYQMNPSIKT